MAIKPEFEHEDEWEEFLDKTDAKKRKEHKFKTYSWTFGNDEDDEGFMRECVILEIPVERDTEPRKLKAKLTPSKLNITLAGKPLLDEEFEDPLWLNVEDSYWEMETKTDKVGCRTKQVRYLLYLRADCPKYITGHLFQSEKENAEAEGAQVDSDDDTVDNRMRVIANLREPEPRRGDDIYFSEEEEFSEPECEGCGSKSVQVMKKADDREFKIYCNDCPYVAKADMFKDAPSIRRQKETDAARERKKKEKERKKEAERLALEDQEPVDLAELEEVD